MIFDTWLYAKPAEWDAVDTDPLTTPLSDEALYAFEQTITGRWKTFPGGYEVYSLTASRAAIDEIVAQLTDVARRFEWNFGNGTDAFNTDGTFNVDPDDVLAVMKDHILYDADGNPIGTEAPTFENPNWGSKPFGQAERIFAGEFTDEFNEEFL